MNLSSTTALRQVQLPRYASIDQTLGDAKGRFFGAGFRQVRQTVREVHIDAGAKEVRASATIVYPSTWSKKRHSIQPHLSTIDAYIIGAQLCEMYLREAYGIDAQSSRRIWLRRCVLKAGSTPTLDLQAVPVHFTLTRTERQKDSLCGYLSSFTGRVGAMGVEFVIDHPMAAVTDRVARYANATDLLGPPEQRYFGSAYTETDVGLYDVELDPQENRARARLTLENASRLAELRGMGAAYVPFVSGLNAIVSVAQLAQALLYHYDDVSREASNNLWMRKVCLNTLAPVEPSLAMPVETWSTKSSLLPIKDTLWRASNFAVTLPGLHAEYSLAHQLPSNAS